MSNIFSRRIPIAWVLFASCSRQDSSAYPSLKLTELSRITIPESLAIRSASITDSGALLLVSRTGGAFRAQPGSGLAAAGGCIGSMWLALRVLHGDPNQIEGIVSAPARRRLCKQGRSTDVALDSNGTMLDAAWDGTRWVWMVRSKSKAVEVLADSPLPPIENARVLWSSKKLRPDQDMYMRGGSGAVLVGEFRSPFRAWVVRKEDRILALSPPDSLRRAIERANDPKRWVALSTWALDSGYLQQFADLNSDTRIMLLYRANGRPVRATSVDAPFGVLAADPVRRRLYVLRRLNHPEVVLYRWDWEMATSPTRRSGRNHGF